MNAAEQIGLPAFSEEKWPISQIPDDKLLPLYTHGRGTFCIFSTAYGAIFVSGWNFHFPTSIERTLWRISRIIILSTIVSSWIVDQYVSAIHPVLKRYITLRRRTVNC
jgi:hypothetical protein